MGIRKGDMRRRVIGEIIYESLSPWHSMSLVCIWRRQPPGMDYSCKYIE